MRLGVVGLLPAEPRAIDAASALAVRSAGFAGVSVILGDPISTSTTELTRVRRVLSNAGLAVAQVNAQYEALVNPAEPLRQAGVRALQQACRAARWLGADNAYVRPGGLNPRGHWLPHPENTSPATFDRLARSLREVVPVAEAEGVRLAVEGHVLSPLPTLERVRDLFDAVGSPALGFNADPVNFVGSLTEAYGTTALIDRMFNLLGSVTVCAHAKDLLVEERFVLHISECVIGTGLLDQVTFLRRFQAACPNGFVLIEHLSPDLIPQARDGLLAAAARAGLTFD